MGVLIMSDFLKDYDTAIDEIAKIKQRLIDHMNEKLDDVKDASYAIPISDNPIVFTIPFSKLGNDWSVEHHSPKIQARELKKYIETHTIEASIKELRYIKEYKQWSTHNQKQKTGIANFNDEFIEQIFSE
jgi:hypothetical protein